MARRLLPGREGVMSGLTFSLDRTVAHAVHDHEPPSYAGHYPVMAQDMFDWLVRKEAELGIDPCTEAQNAAHRSGFMVKTTLRGQTKVSRLVITMSECLQSRFQEVSLEMHVSITNLLREAINDILSRSIIVSVLESDTGSDT